MQLNDMHNGKYFETFFSNLAGKFSQHIYNSIPNYEQLELSQVKSLCKTYQNFTAPYVLDIGASEGTFSILLNKLAKDSFFTWSLDPNKDMEKVFNDLNKSNYNKFLLSPFGAGFDNFKNYYPENDFNIIRESMAFQFISNNRSEHYKNVSKALKKGGIFITNSKNLNNNKNLYNYAEKLKDEYKRQSFTQKEMNKKSTEVLEGMQKCMITIQDKTKFLSRNFSGYYLIWQSGNFYSFIAFNDELGQKTARDYVRNFYKVHDYKNKLNLGEYNYRLKY